MNKDDANKYKTTIIFGDQVKSVDLIEESSQPKLELDLEKIFDQIQDSELKIETSSASLDTRLLDLVEWLKRSHLPVKLDDESVVNILDTVFIKWPYQPDNCHSTNEIILDRVRKLIVDFNRNKEF